MRSLQVRGSEVEMPRKPRRAKLTIEESYSYLGAGSRKINWLRLTYKNGEPAMHSETVEQPKRARAAIIRAMVDVLESEGYVVTKPEEAGR